MFVAVVGSIGWVSSCRWFIFPHVWPTLCIILYWARFAFRIFSITCLWTFCRYTNGNRVIPILLVSSENSRSFKLYFAGSLLKQLRDALLFVINTHCVDFLNALLLSPSRGLCPHMFLILKAGCLFKCVLDSGLVLRLAYLYFAHMRLDLIKNHLFSLLQLEKCDPPLVFHDLAKVFLRFKLRLLSS